jgi:hypothetical protein
MATYLNAVRPISKCARNVFIVSPCYFRTYEARMTGLEPATSGVTGRCSNQLSYIPISGSMGQVYRKGVSSQGVGSLPC